MGGDSILDFLRGQIIGRNLILQTPFGRRLLHYFDWTASGRGLRFVENYLRDTVLPIYANTHTEDDATGRATTLRLHAAERILKESIHAGPEYHVVHCGSGTTEAIHRLMQILGVYLPPLLLHRDRVSLFEGPQVPVVFIGPYEHHSNVIPWREGLCHLVEIEPAADGGIDPDAVEAALLEPRWKGRPKIGCFSAASNVTGIRTDVHEIAQRLHRHGALACFDWAAAAPYEDLDMSGKDGAGLDAVVFSPHKFMGGPGSSGVLVFHERIYHRDLPPSFGGGGTVAYVGPRDHDYLGEIEDREKPGTPGILQALRTALALQVRDRVGLDQIREIEDRFLRRVMERWLADPRVEVLGDPDPARRIGIVSFNIRDGERYLHPRFVTRLLCDLFGIQSRAGCSCAGPYGHRLLGIDEPTSERYRAAIRTGCQLIKPGWVRINVHFTMTEEEVDFLLDAVDFVAEHGARFLSLYECDLDSGVWNLRGWENPGVPFGLEDALAAAGAAEEETPLGEAERRTWRAGALAEARSRAADLPEDGDQARLPEGLEQLAFFRTLHVATGVGTDAPRGAGEEP